jgi:multiple sugar transport system substrate-binding protein
MYSSSADMEFLVRLVFAARPGATALRSRRSLHAALLAAGLVIGSVHAVAGEQADRAIAAARKLVASGEVKPGTVLRLRAKQGNLVSLLGRDGELQQEWERLTGIPIDASVMPQVDSMTFIRGRRDADLTIARAHELADLDAAGLIVDLRPLLQRFGFQLKADEPEGYLLLDAQSRRGDKVLAIPADLDVALLFLRRDLLENEHNRARFRARHGRELAPPTTWAEYQRLVEFFHRPQDGFYGAGEPREKHTAWMYWLPRYLSASGNVAPFFDAKMRPQLLTAAGIAATENFVATVPFSPPQVLEDGKDFNYTLPLFVRGSTFSTILTVATAKIANREGSAIRGRFIAAPMPGYVHQGKLLRSTAFIYGNNLVIPSNGSQPELAFLYAMWLTDSDNSLKSVTANGIADPYRHHHLRDEQVRALYTPQALDLMRDELRIVRPGGTGMPGDAEYMAALSDQLWQAAAGRITPREAMARTSREWDAITDRLGRAAQLAHWRALQQGSPGTAATGRP